MTRAPLPPTDWPALLADVARLLLGEPPRTADGGDTWRYRTRGSLSVHVGGAYRGTWRDFEADMSGGVLDLIEHVHGCDRAGALRWLTAAGLIDPSSGAAAPPARPRVSGSAQVTQNLKARPPDDSGAPAESPTAAVAAAILAVAVLADGTPARAYLAERGVWPPDGIGPDLPPSVRWLPAATVPTLPAWPGPNRDRRLMLPAEAAGALVFAVGLPGAPATAVSIEAVTADGLLLDPRWRRSLGGKTGAVFEAQDAPGGDLVLVEGELDALAVALTLRAGCVRSVSGTAGYRPSACADPAARPVVVMPDADHAGVAAVTRLLLPGALPGRSVRVVRADEGDPADWLAAWLTERAGIREHDGGMDAATASAAAWSDLLTAIERGESILEGRP